MYIEFRDLWFVIHELQLKHKGKQQQQESYKQIFVAVEYSSNSEKGFQIQLLPFGYVTLNWIPNDVFETVQFEFQNNKPTLKIDGKNIEIETRKKEFDSFKVVLPSATQKLPIVICTKGQEQFAVYAYDFFIQNATNDLCDYLLQHQSSFLRVDKYTSSKKFQAVKNGFHPAALYYPQNVAETALQEQQEYIPKEKGVRVYIGEDFVPNLPVVCVIYSESIKKGQKRKFDQIEKNETVSSETVNTVHHSLTTTTTNFHTHNTVEDNYEEEQQNEEEQNEENNQHEEQQNEEQNKDNQIDKEEKGKEEANDEDDAELVLSLKLFPSRTSLLDSCSVSSHTLAFLQQQQQQSSNTFSPSRFLHPSVLQLANNASSTYQSSNISSSCTASSTTTTTTTTSSNVTTMTSSKPSQTFCEVKQLLEDLDWNIQPHDVVVPQGSALTVDEIDFLVHEITRKAHENIPEGVWCKERCSYCWNYGHRICENCFDFSVCDSCLKHLNTSITSSKSYNPQTDHYLLDVYCISCFFDQHEVAAQECIQKRIPFHEALG